jgi:uncharacterized membrane protein
LVLLIRWATAGEPGYQVMSEVTVVLAHGEGGHGWGWYVEPWEIHPILVHFPIAFLLGAVALDLYAWWRKSQPLGQAAGGLLFAGVLTGILTAGAGLGALYTHPETLTEEAERLMTWHLWVQVAALVLFTAVAWARWRSRQAWPSPFGRLVSWVAAGTLVVGSGIGGYIVYHGGAGIEPGVIRHGAHGEEPPGHLHHHETRPGPSHAGGHGKEDQ